MWGNMIIHHFEYTYVLYLSKCEKPDISEQNRIPDEFCPGKIFCQKVSLIMQISKMVFLKNRIFGQKTGSGRPGDIQNMWDHHKLLF